MTARKSAAPRLPDEHSAHVELSAKGCYYAWCSHGDCYWQSPYRKSASEVYEYARKHEARYSPKAVK